MWLIVVVVMIGILLSGLIWIVVFFYGVGVYGILMFNDFKVIIGDKVMNIRILLVLYGVWLVVVIVSVIMVVF